jgi:tRNA pseudouridine38-40 synthase
MDRRSPVGSGRPISRRPRARLRPRLAVLEPDVPSVAAAGRTDAGVHATGQVAQADMAKAWDPFRLAEALNWHLKPAPVAVVACAEVAGDWHARFSAVERRYTYRVISRRAPLVEAAGRAWHVAAPGRGGRCGRARRICSVAMISRPSAPLSARRRARSRRSTRIEIEEVPLAHGREVRFHLRRGPSCTIRCGPSSARWSGSERGPGRPSACPRRLRRSDRAACGPVAPPEGLCLTGVGYPEDPFAGGWREA